MSRNDWFKMYSAWNSMIQAADDKELARAIKLALNMFATGEIPSMDLNNAERMLFQTFKNSIEEAYIAYDEASEAGKRGAEARKAKRNNQG